MVRSIRNRSYRPPADRAAVQEKTETKAAPVYPRGCPLGVPILEQQYDASYPDRTRCVTCRRNLFTGRVIDGFYCSRECAGLGPLPTLRYTPAECAVPSIGSRPTRRIRYDLRSEAEAVRRPYESVYHCRNCHGWHSG